MTSGKRVSLASAIAALSFQICLLGGCGSAPPEQHYPLEGEIVAVDAAKKMLTVQHGDIPGLMPGMTMSYAVAVPKELEGLKVGDKISADLVVSESKSRLERILLEKDKPTPPTAQPAP